MRKNIRFINLILSILALPQFILPSTAFASAKFCNQITAFKPKVSLTDYQLHGPRLLAMQMNDDRMMRDLLALSGRVPVDCNGCIRDRYREEDKQRARQFLVSRLQQMGLKISIERTKLPPKTSSGPSDNWINWTERFKAVNWKYISKDWLHHLFWEYGMVSDMRKYVITMLDWPAVPESFTRLTAEMCEEIAAKTDRIASTADKELIAKIEKKGLSVSLTHADAKRMAVMLREGENMQPPPPPAPPAPKKRARREATPENELVAEDAPRVINIVAEIRGTKRPEEVIEIIAHYDTKKEDAGGADDNGVGLVTSLELMRLMTAHPPSRTVRVIFSDREEIDSLGAEYHVKQLKNRPNEKLVGVLVPDMFGYSPLGRPRFVLELGTEKDFTSKEAYLFSKKFATLMAKQWDLYNDRVADMEVVTFSAESQMGDHGPYWDADHPAIFIASPMTPLNPANHSTRDKVENMNVGIFTEVAHFLGEVLARHAGASIDLKDMAHVNNLDFLKSTLKPAAERTDESADLYFEVKKTYTSSGPGYTGGYVSPSYNVGPSGPAGAGYRSNRSSDSSPRQGGLFVNGSYVGRPTGGRRDSSSDDHSSVPRTPPYVAPTTSLGPVKGSGPGYTNSGPAGMPMGSKGFSSGTALGGNAEIKSIQDLDKAKKAAALLTGATKPAAEAPGGYIEETAANIANTILFRIRPTKNNGK